MVGVGSGDVDDVDVGIGDEFMIGTVSFDAGRRVDFFKKCFGAGCRGGGGGCDDGVLDIVDVAGSGVAEDIFAEGWKGLV